MEVNEFKNSMTIIIIFSLEFYATFKVGKTNWFILENGVFKLVLGSVINCLGVLGVPPCCPLISEHLTKISPNFISNSNH